MSFWERLRSWLFSIPRQLAEWLWKLPPAIAISFLIAIGLLVYALWFQASNDLAQSRFAKEYSQVITNTITLHMIYPTRLQVDSLQTTGRPLVIWITDSSPNPMTQVYTATLSDPSYLLFTDAEGNMASPEMILTTTAQLQTRGVLYIQAAPLAEKLPATVPLSITLVKPDHSLMADIYYHIYYSSLIEIEDPNTSWRRFFLAHFSGQTALLLSLTIAAAGWMLNYLKQQQEQEREVERRTKERHDYIHTVNTLINTDLLGAMASLLRLENQAIRERWEESLRTELTGLRSRLERYKEQILRDIGEAIWQSNKKRAADEALEAMTQFFGEEEFGRQLKMLKPVFSTWSVSILEMVNSPLEAAFWLWDQYDEDAREIVVHVLLWIDEHGGKGKIEEKFKTVKDQKLRILRDLRLKEKNISQDWASYRYNDWPRRTQPQVEDSPDISKWLENMELSCNPFGAGTPPLDPLLVPTWADPSQWGTVRAARPTVILGSIDQDRAAAGLKLYHELIPRNLQSAKVAFTIQFTLPLANISSDALTHAYLEAIAHVISETWITFLAIYPGALLDLPKPEQAILAELLLCTTGSRPALSLRLLAAGLADDAGGRMFLRRLEEILGESTSITTPSREKLMLWLSVRPPGLQHTYLIVDCQLDQSVSQCEHQAKALLNIAYNLAGVGVILKLFMPPGSILSSNSIDTVELKWESQALKKMLGDRIYQASKKYRTFGELFGPELLVKADERLVDRAGGSLGKLLELGNAVIRTHVKLHPGVRELDSSDLDDVLQQADSAI